MKLAHEQCRGIPDPDPADAVPTSPQRYCYCCRKPHPESQMRPVESCVGMRWRCKAGIKAARQDGSWREAWGRATSEANRSQARHGIDHLNKLLREREIA
ncbi:MAG: hypothetical protein NTV11_14425 [Rhodocyclales bacterium]|nr:hypothetical protein [Rhodocyclales bacterium]